MLWISPIFIEILQITDHICLDSTYITTKDFYQLLIVMCYNSIIDKKIPCSFIFMNNKSPKLYELVLKKLYNIITFKDSKALKLISITSDFEKGLINVIKTVFEKTRYVGRFFHYVKT